MTTTAEHRHIEHQNYQDKVAEDARLALASRSQNAADFREMALMLGLIEEVAEDFTFRANPWDTEIDEPLPALTPGKYPHLQ